MKALYFEEHGEREVLQYGDLPDLKNRENHENNRKHVRTIVDHEKTIENIETSRGAYMV